MSNSIRQGDQDGSFFDDNEVDTDNEWTFVVDSFVRIAMNTIMTNKDNIIEHLFVDTTLSLIRNCLSVRHTVRKKTRASVFLLSKDICSVYFLLIPTKFTATFYPMCNYP